MAWTKRGNIVCLVLLLIIPGLQAQQLEAGLNASPGLAHNMGVDPGMNGWSLNLAYLHQLEPGRTISGGMELGYTAWGGQSLLAVGYRHGQVHMLDLEILNGLALYRQGSNYVFGLGASYSRRFFKAKNGLLLSAGVRYTIQPAYREYSPIYSYIDIPLRLRWSHLFGTSY